MQYDIDGGNITVVVGEEARMDVPTALNYIKSGQDEIEATVNAGIDAFDLNAANKTTDYNDNASAKVTAYNNNATAKTDAFDLNASGKTNDFNDNYTIKKGLIDASVDAAAGSASAASASADLAQQWAVKMDGKVADEDYSAKYYADLASQSAGATGANKDLSNLTAAGEARFTAKQDVIDSSHKLSASLVSGLANVATSGAYSDLSGTPSLATVATSGSYNDLNNKPDLSNYIQDGSAFTSYIKEQRTNPVIELINTAVATGTPLNYDTTWWFHFKDKNERTMGGVNYRYTATYGSSIAYLWAYKSNASTDTEYATIGVHYPATDAPFVDVSAILRPDQLNDNTLNLGTASYRWKQLFAGTTTISTSDEREKQDIEAIPDAVLDAWGDVEFYRFKYKDAVTEKGSAARWHTGMIAQRIESVFASHGLNARDYGLLCYDEWAADEEEGTPAGNRYALRYEECLTMEAAYQRRRADRIEARLAALEARA